MTTAGEAVPETDPMQQDFIAASFLPKTGTPSSAR
jgi:hypothetical protein